MSDQVAFMLAVAIFAVAAISLLALWTFRSINKPAQGASSPQTGFGFNEMSLLFQTLRSLVHEQKVLAREFNRNVDKKVALVREVTRAFTEERQRLAEAQQELRRLLAQTGKTLQEEAPVTDASTDVLEEAVMQPQTSTIEQAAPEAAVDEAAAEPESAIAESAAEEAAVEERVEDNLDTWVGLDFVENDEEPEDAAPVEVQETQEEREQSREAVNALLNLNDAQKPAGIIHPFPEAPDEAADGLSAVRARAFSFHDSGMTVSQIARALGIGKGEVRLMLNLREKAE